MYNLKVCLHNTSPHQLYMPSSSCFLATAIKLKAKDNYLAATMLLFYILLPQHRFHRSILKGSNNGVLPLIESGFWTLSIIQCFPKKHNVSETGSVETTFIYLRAETDPVSETLCSLEKHWTMDKVQKPYSFKRFHIFQWSITIHHFTWWLKQIHFPKCYVFFEHQMMDKVQKPNFSKWHVYQEYKPLNWSLPILHEVNTVWTGLEGKQITVNVAIHYNLFLPCIHHQQ
jgi:hypothetical protein